MQTSPAVEQMKTLNGPRVRGISPVGKQKVYGGNDLPKSRKIAKHDAQTVELPQHYCYCTEIGLLLISFKAKGCDQQVTV